MHSSSETTRDVQRIGVGPRLSEAAIFNGVVYLAGQISEHTTLDIKGQMHDVLNQIDTLLAQANSDKSRILSAQIYITDMANFQAMNEVWDTWVVAGHTPPRATVEAALANPACLVEVVVVAAQY
jgi:enamine deaminase RidA (YjgF/YER057c/UK114 family)